MRTTSDLGAADVPAETAVCRVLVVDSWLDAYGHLAAASRRGEVQIHFRSSALAARALMQRIRFDRCIVGDELDDMAGEDFLELLRADADRSCREVVAASEVLATMGAQVVEPMAAIGSPATGPSGTFRFTLPGGGKQVAQSLAFSAAAAATTLGLLLSR